MLLSAGYVASVVWRDASASGRRNSSRVTATSRAISPKVILSFRARAFAREAPVPYRFLYVRSNLLRGLYTVKAPSFWTVTRSHRPSQASSTLAM
jgi:hypothetical protein